MKSIIAILFSVMFTLPAMAGEFYVLEFSDVHMKANQGQDTLKLKRAMRNQYPSVEVRDSELLSVMLVAKTRMGQGKAHLLVGQSSSVRQKIGGKSATFKSTTEKSFDRHLFMNPKNNSNGRWQMKLRGNFIVRQVVIEIGASSSDLKLDYSHVHMKAGQGQDTLKLRAKARSQHGIITQDYRLEGVTLIAKTRRGLGSAQLKVGGELTFPEQVGGHPSEFNDEDEWTYYKTEFTNPKENSNGAWQIKLKGNFKIKEVILHMVKK